MYLQDNHADLRLETGESVELWWITGDDEVVVMTDCPGNYPRTVVHTLTHENAKETYHLLVSEGWEVKRESQLMSKLVIGG